MDFKPIFFINPRPEIPEIPDVKDKQDLDVKYPLIEPYVNAHIFWDKANNELFYSVEEPQLDEREKNILDLLENEINELINISFISLKNTEIVLEYLEKNLRVLLSELKIAISKDSYLKLMYYIYRDFVGLNEVEPLLKDYYIEDIECNGINTPIYIVHRKYRNLRTSVIFPDPKKLTSFVEKLAQKCGKYISYASPLLDGSLPDGSRIQAVYTQDITSHGPSFTIRKFTKEPWTPIKLMQFKTISPEMLAYLWVLIENESNIMIIGGTGSGKCVTGDTPIYLSDGSIQNIKEIIETKFSNAKIKTKGDWEFVNGDGTEVLSMSKDNLKIIKTKVDKFWRHKAPENLIKIITRSGRNIVTTPEHPFFTLKEGGIVKIRADNITKEERIAVPRNINLDNEFKQISLNNYLKNRKDVYVNNVFDQVEEAINAIKKRNNQTEKEIAKFFGIRPKTFGCWKKDNAIPINIYYKIIEKANFRPKIRLYAKGKTSNKITKIPKMSKELYKFAAYVIADGHLYKNEIDFHNTNKVLRDEFAKLGEQIFGDKGVEKFPKNRTPKIAFYNSVASAILNEALEIPYGNKARKVKVPNSLLMQDNETICSFIQAVSDCESHVTSNEIEICTTSKKLAEGLNTLLLRVGVLPHIITRPNHYRIYISGMENLKKYRNKINYLHPSKLESLNKLVNKRINRCISNVDLIPNVSNLIKNTRAVLKLNQREFAEKINISRRFVGMLESSFRYPSIHTFRSFNDYIAETDLPIEHKNLVNSLANSDIFWDEIINVEILKEHNEKYVYDLTIEEHHNFLAGNIPIVAHNTTILNALAFFIPPAARIVSIEDSVTGKSEIIYKLNDKIKKTTIEQLTKQIENNLIKIEDIEVLTLDEDMKVKLGKPSKFIKHQTDKDIYKITTSTGRVIEVTKDHSLFNLTTEGLVEVKPENLEENNSFIAAPRSLPIEGKGVFNFNLLDNLKIFKHDFLFGYPVKAILKKYSYKDFKVSKSTHQWWKRRNILPIKHFEKLDYTFEQNEINKLDIKSRNSTKIPVKFDFDDDFITLLGLWVGDGSYDNYNKNRVILSSNEPESIALYKRISDRLGIKVSMMDDDWSWAFNSTVFYKLMKYVLKLDGNSKTKKIPEFVYNFTNEQLKRFISGYYSADGTVKTNEICCCSQSDDILVNIQTLLLRFGIISRLGSIRKDECKELNISSYDNITKFKEIGFIQDRQNIRLSSIGNVESNHTCSDVIPINPNWLDELKEYRSYFKNYSGINNSLPGRKFMNNFIADQEVEIPESCFEFLDKITNSDLLWDKVVRIEKLPKKSRYVYDISVPGTEKFISQNILLHNTRELNLQHENWLPGVTREGVGASNLTGTKEGDVTLFDLLRESFRQRPDYVIVGEIRGKEAYVLFQGMSSLRENEEVFVLNKNQPLRIKIKDLEKYNVQDLKVITYDLENKKHLMLPLGGFVRHPKRNKLYKLVTKLGREVTVTPDHSLFTIKDGKIVDIKTNELVIGSKVIIPAKIPCSYHNIEQINLLDYLPDLRVYAPNYIKEASNKIGYSQASNLCGCSSITDYYSNFKRAKPSAMKGELFLKLMKEAEVDFDLKNIEVRYDKKSKAFNGLLELSDDFLKLFGYYISEGTIGKGKNSHIAFYNQNEEILNDMRKVIYNLTGSKPDERITDRGYGWALELSFSHKVIYEFIKKYCGRKEEKGIPDFIFGLDKRKIGIFLGSLYAGDGSIEQNHFAYYTISKKLASDVAQLLLVFGIVATISKRNRKGRKTTDHEIKFYSSYKKEEFSKYVRPISKEIELKLFKKTDNKLLNDLYCDEIKSIEILNLDKSEYVYDLSVPGTENFIGGFGSLLLHNSGHPSFGTMHAEDVETMVRRLETPPIELSASLVESLDVVCVIAQTKVQNKEVRKIKEIVEIVKVREGVGHVDTNTPFVWDPRTDKFYFKGVSEVFNKIMIHRGIDKNKLYKEFTLRTKLLMALYNNNIVGFKEVSDIISAYYKTPELVLKKFNIS